ncbi:MAG: M61 family metallopeptidase [Pyrinomonadaceae bacterium]
MNVRLASARLLLLFQLSLLTLTITTIAPSLVLGQVAPPAPILIDVDATDAPRKILHAKLTFPAKPGPITLLYPKWIPGEHGPTGPVTDLAGLKISGGGRSLPWRRDDVEMYAFHVDVPAGVNSLDVALDLLLPAGVEGFSAAQSATANLVVLSWNQVLLYPAGYPSDTLSYVATLHLPSGWKFGTALPITGAGPSGNGAISFQKVSLTTLVDSPVIAGAHFRTIKLTESTAPSFQIDLVSDSEAALEMPTDQIANYRQLVMETNALFGAHHYDHYHFLYTLSDNVAHFGLEHHESSDDRVAERTLLDESLRKLSADLLPHEFVHSWNGKYRRPAGLATPDYEQPMKGELLWVYEGLTEYLGSILAARSGLRSPEDQREHLAAIAAYLDKYPGRTWRPLIDTTVAAQLLYNAAGAWAAWRRGVDFYDEGELIWLEADTIIRRQTGGTRSLDDFCKKFHGPPSTAPMVKPYTFDDVVNTMNNVAPYDWRSFFNTRVISIEPRAPLGGITNSGWRLVYTDIQSEYQKAMESASRSADLSYSLGLRLTEEGTISDVIPGMPATEVGLAPGMKIIAVGGRGYSLDRLRKALKDRKTSRSPLELTAQNGDFLKTFRIDYHGGERFPHLERDGSKPDLLQQIIDPLQPRR